MFKNYIDCLINDKIIQKSQRVLKRDYHNMYTEEVNKIALRSNDDKRWQTFDRTETYPYGANPYIVCESETLKVHEAKEKLRICKSKSENWKC